MLAACGLATACSTCLAIPEVGTPRTRSPAAFPAPGAIDGASRPGQPEPAKLPGARADVAVGGPGFGAGAVHLDADAGTPAEPAEGSTVKAVDCDRTDADTGDGGRVRRSLGAVLTGDGRAAWRTFSLFARREVWPRQPDQWLYLGGLAGLSAVLENNRMALRQDVLRSAFYRHSQWTQIGGTLGLTHVAYGTAGALYLGGLIFDQEEVRRTGLILAESVLAAQAVAGAVNFAVSEKRPEAGGAITFFHSGGSGVSIHMTNTMALARVLDHRFARLRPSDSRSRRIAKILAKTAIYSIPAVTGWQRMRADQHYLWSVVLGAGLSAFVTDAMLRSSDGAPDPSLRP
jgi:hypothetical protein